VNGGDVLVVGGGIVGLAVAWRAAQEGLAVTVVDPAPGRGASWAAAGMLAPVTEARAAEAPLTALGLASLRRWPSFADELADEIGVEPACLGLRRDGTLQVAVDEDDLRALDDLRVVYDLLGLPAEPCPVRRCRQLEPLLTPRLCGALLVDGDWQVDPRRVVDALRQALARRGATVLTRAVRRLDVDDALDRCLGVTLDDGTMLRSASVVLAAGAWSATVAGLPEHCRPPVRPVKGEILRLRPGRYPAALRHVVRGSVRGTAVYLVPRDDGELVVGATMEEAGWDTDVRAVAVRDLLWAATELVPAVGELVLHEHVAGLRPATPDNAPVLGPTPVVGLHLATGHHRNGVLLAPLTGDAVVAGVLGRPTPDIASGFSLGRFASPSREDGSMSPAGGAQRAPADLVPGRPAPCCLTPKRSRP